MQLFLRLGRTYFVHGELTGSLDRCHLLIAVMSCEGQFALPSHQKHIIKKEMSLLEGVDVILIKDYNST